MGPCAITRMHSNPPLTIVSARSVTRQIWRFSFQLWVSQRDRFRWIAGESDLSAYEGSPGKLRRFCSSCGSHLIDEYFDPPL